MAITAKPTDYTVNTGHAKCPDHLWMIDEGSGTTLTDIGKVGGLNMTLQNADMWGTDGGLGSPVITCASATNRYARRTGYTMPSTSALWVALMKPGSTTNPTLAEYLMGVAQYDAASVTYGGIQYTSAGTGGLTCFYDYGTNSAGNQTESADTYDANWHFGAAMVRGGSVATQVIKKVSSDGAAWTASAAFGSSYVFPYDGGGAAPNALGIGCRPAQSVNSIFNGTILAAMCWDNFDFDTADDAWIAALYADPWQFLNTDVASPLILPHRSSGGMLDLSGNFRG